MSSEDSYLSQLSDPDRPMLCIFNLHAGQLVRSSGVHDIMVELMSSGKALRVFQTRYPGHAADLVHSQHGLFDVLCCVGGDGTLNEVMGALLDLPENERVPLGYIPTGSACDFARTLGIPLDHYGAAAAAVNRGRPYKLDLGRLNERSFSYVASFGAFSMVAVETSREMKVRLGQLAYLIEGIRSIKSISHIEVEVTHDQGSFEGKLLFGAVLNSLSVGGLINVRNDELFLDDGLFEMILIEAPASLSQIPGIIADIIGQNYSNPLIHFARTKEVDFRFKEATPWTVDGEFGGEGLDFTVRNEHRAVEILLPDSQLKLPLLQWEERFPESADWNRPNFDQT